MSLSSTQALRDGVGFVEEEVDFEDLIGGRAASIGNQDMPAGSGPPMKNPVPMPPFFMKPNTAFFPGITGSFPNVP